MTPQPTRHRRPGKAQLFLMRKSALSVWAQLAIRLMILMAMFLFIVAVHWVERDSLKDSHDGSVSFTDVLYFTMISVTTTGYGDIVPISDRARMFDAFIVTPIRIIFLLLLAGTAYTFAIKRTWNRWIMQLIQNNLSDHIVVAGYGASNVKAVKELLARGTDPRRLVVIDCDDAAIADAKDCGVTVLLADATRNETLAAARIEQASALIVAAGRDDSNILVVLTARKMAPALKISVTIRDDDNEDIAKQAGADTVINPVSFSGLLMASSLEGPHRAEYLADLATTSGQVMLRERVVEAHEVGMTLAQICTGVAVRLIRGEEAHGPATIEKVELGDRILEIIDSKT
ncbi:potassium channel protein [Sphingomonas piscis]|uniref:Potassium channel protein n=1 Tax=Sphingomonas piscis TaxID=2714943 RepID=A0A6G7YS24_9SPHN|nr:potassium channel protein [Sphingomonas piscis]QIK79548.1 potassium channel protein [Sphingomonas piscis]